MTKQKVYHAVVDDTSLVANISEIKKWVTLGALTLTVPICTLERLHILKRDTSQIGINARETLKFLDRVTSGRDKIPEDSIQLQGPDDQYQTWQEVEAHLVPTEVADAATNGLHDPAGSKSTTQDKAPVLEQAQGTSPNAAQSTIAHAQMLLDKLNFAKEPETGSNASTPPTSPSSSNLQSSKTSPEVTNAKPFRAAVMNDPTEQPDAIIVPHASRPLINAAVFLLSRKTGQPSAYTDSFMLTNDNDTACIARKFGLKVKNSHQVRSSIYPEAGEAKNPSRSQHKHSPKPSIDAPGSEPRTLFSYEDEVEDDDVGEEEVVFHPRSHRSGNPTRDRHTLTKPNAENRRSAELPAPPAPPPIPTEEIDPDSFDRGAFSRARPSTPNDSNVPKGENRWPAGRSSARGAFPSTSATRSPVHSQTRGMGRGSARGRGKLFVP